MHTRMNSQTHPAADAHPRLAFRRVTRQDQTRHDWARHSNHARSTDFDDVTGTLCVCLVCVHACAGVPFNRCFVLFAYRRVAASLTTFMGKNTLKLLDKGEGH